MFDLPIFFHHFNRLQRLVGLALDSIWNTTKLRLNGATLGQGVSVGGKLKVYCAPGGRIIIGNRVRFRSGFQLNPLAHSLPNAIWVGRNGTLLVEDGAGLSATTIVCASRITIGHSTLVGSGTQIYDTDFHPLTAEARRRHEPPLSSPVVIEPECFIGAFCIILKGVTIGRGSVVGAGSVVTRCIPPGEVWAGNPARRVR